MSCNPFKSINAEWDRDFQRAKISFKDSGAPSQYQASNPDAKHFNLFRVDGYLINTATKGKCDFLLIEFRRHQDKKHDCVPLHSYFIELKGSDLRKANAQILQSIKDLHPAVGSSMPHARIVSNRINTLELNSPEERQLKTYLKRLKGAHLYIKNSVEKL